MAREDGSERWYDQGQVSLVQVMKEGALDAGSSHRIRSVLCSRKKVHLDVLQMTQENAGEKKVTNSMISVRRGRNGEPFPKQRYV